ncbi:MAG: isoprenylcysteine carboxylmethyltransferase family protein [Terriglobia bacterium]|jgi:protein-S-isoprenylcysteine O-methyltransferase Ste14|nr:isoprenylcysteine carboxylmethyltransferase family protein [Terriglobia bacterium]
MKKFLVLAYGVAVYVFFFVTFLYAIGFVGDLFVPKNIDNGPLSSTTGAIIIDLLLLGLFAIQHSVMARMGFKRVMTKLIAWHIERSTYVLAATICLAVLMWQWRPIPGIVWQVQNPTGVLALQALYLLGWLGILISTFLINHFDLFGLHQAYRYFRGEPLKPIPFKTPALYKMVRHPIYLCFLVSFWAAPTMTAGHLLFSVMTTGYIFVGIFFEERDLVHHYGEQYRKYRQMVPMIIPWFFRRASQPTDEPKKMRGAA